MRLSDLQPWDQINYYATPTETSYSFPNPVPVQIAKADPQRVLLVFGISGPSAGAQAFVIPTAIAFTNVTVAVPLPRIMVSMNPNVGLGNGIMLSGMVSYLVVSQDVWGPAVNQAWYGFSASGALATLSVQEVFQLSYPDQPGKTNLIQEVDNGSYARNLEGRTNGTRRTKLYTDRWTKSPEGQANSMALFREFGVRDPEWAGEQQ